MALYNGPACRLCRRTGMKLMLKGERCFTPRCAFERRPYAPGQHGQQRRRKLSEYGIQLREKQKVKYLYGVLERQLERYFAEAERRAGLPGENLLQMLEARMDNAVYRLGLAESRRQARQLIRSGHFAVDGRKVTIPSFQVRPGQRIEVAEESRQRAYFRQVAQAGTGRPIPSWLQRNPEMLSGQVVGRPSPGDVDVAIASQLVVEFYSR